MKNNNKTVVITGGTKGIGAGIAKKYLEEFDVTDDTRISCKTPYNAFNFFREKIEELNIIIFQIG